MPFIDLFRPKWRHSNSDIREKAVMKLVDQAILAEIAKNDNTSYVQEKALARLTDQEALCNIAKNHSSAWARETATSKLTNNAELIEIAKSDADSSVRMQAILKITDQAELVDIAKNDADTNVRTQALAKITDPARLAEIPSDALVYLASWDSKRILGPEIFTHISDSADLIKLLENTKHIGVSRWAFEALWEKDRAFLVDSMLNYMSKHRDIKTEYRLPPKPNAFLVLTLFLCSYYKEYDFHNKTHDAILDILRKAEGEDVLEIMGGLEAGDSKNSWIVDILIKKNEHAAIPLLKKLLLEDRWFIGNPNTEKKISKFIGMEVEDLERIREDKTIAKKIEEKKTYRSISVIVFELSSINPPVSPQTICENILRKQYPNASLGKFACIGILNSSISEEEANFTYINNVHGGALPNLGSPFDRVGLTLDDGKEVYALFFFSRI